MVQIDGHDLNITAELQTVLRNNQPQTVRKAVIDKRKDEKGDLVHKKVENNVPLFVDAVVNTHPFVYFDSAGKYYFRVFDTVIMEHEGKQVEVIVTNPRIKVKTDCNKYAKGIVSHRQIIPGSELWDNGSDSQMPHSEVVSKGDPSTRIVYQMSREDVLRVNLKPQGDSLVAKVANSSEAEKTVMIKELLGDDFIESLKELNAYKAMQKAKRDAEDEII